MCVSLQYRSFPLLAVCLILLPVFHTDHACGHFLYLVQFESGVHHSYVIKGCGTFKMFKIFTLMHLSILKTMGNLLCMRISLKNIII